MKPTLKIGQKWRHPNGDILEIVCFDALGDPLTVGARDGWPLDAGSGKELAPFIGKGLKGWWYSARELASMEPVSKRKLSLRPNHAPT